MCKRLWHCSALVAGSVGLLAGGATSAGAQPYAHEKLIQPTYVTTAPTYGDVELEGDVLAYGVREEIDQLQFAEGAVFLFGRDQGGPGNWGLLKKLASPVPTQNEGFGAAVELQGDELFVASFILGPAGTFRVFERDQGGPDNWGMVREVAETDAAFCEFGRSMDVEGDILVVGSACGGGSEGRVFVYERDLGGPGLWGRRQVLAPAGVSAGDRFGHAVALSGDLLAVGAPYRDLSPFPGDDGSVYLFRRDPTSGMWVEWRTLTDGATTGSLLGLQLALDGSTLLALRGGDNRVSAYRCWHGGPGNWGYLGDLIPPMGGGFGAAEWSESMEIDGALAVIGGGDRLWLFDLYDWSFIGEDLQQILPSGGDHSLAFVALDGNLVAGSGALFADTNNYVLDVFDAPTADLAVVVDDGETVAMPGGTLSYDIVFSNAGTEAAPGARLEVDLTGGSLDLDNVTWTCVVSGGAGAGTECPLAAGTWSDLDDGPLLFGIEPGDLVTISLDAPVLASPEPPVECRGRVRAPAALAVDPESGDNSALDGDDLGGPLIFGNDFESGDLLPWWKQTGCP